MTTSINWITSEQTNDIELNSASNKSPLDREIRLLTTEIEREGKANLNKKLKSMQISFSLWFVVTVAYTQRGKVSHQLSLQPSSPSFFLVFIIRRDFLRPVVPVAEVISFFGYKTKKIVKIAKKKILEFCDATTSTFDSLLDLDGWNFLSFREMVLKRTFN